LLDDPQMGGRLADLRTLASGFVDLASAAAAPPPEPKKPGLPLRRRHPRQQPQQLRKRRAEGLGCRGRRCGCAGSAAPGRASSADHDFVASPRTCLLEIVIDEQGRVINLALRLSIHPMSDPQLLAAAKGTLQAGYSGRSAVKFRKLIQITVDKR
jgi:hypothetical protein